MKKLSIFLCLIFLSQLSFSKPLKVYYVERPPYYFTKNKVPTGFLLNLQKKILNDANITVTFIPLPIKRILRKIKEKNSPYCSLGWFKTKSREKYANFTLPIYQNSPLVVISLKSNAKVIQEHTSLENLFLDKALTSVQLDGFSYGDKIDELIKKHQPQVYYITGEAQQLIRMLAKKRISYLLIAPEEIKTILSTNNLNPKKFSTTSFQDMGQGNKRYLICGKGVDKKTINKINKSIQKFVKLPSF